MSHEIQLFREPGFGFVTRWCDDCGRYFLNDAEHERHIKYQINQVPEEQ